MASSRRDDRSGLLDIHALSSVIDAQRRGGASASGLAMPTFASSWALHDVPVSAPAVQATPAVRHATAGPDHRPLYAMIVALSIAVLSLGTYVALRSSPPQVVERTAVVVPAVVETPPLEPAQAAPVVVAGLPEAVEPASAEPEVAEPEPEPVPEASRRNRRSPRASRPVAKPKPAPAPEPKSSGVLPVECVIDPSRCTNGKLRTKPEAKDPPSSAGLPAALTSSQIRSAMGSVKPQAKACGAKHAGHAGEKVKVKLSVEGATGKVTSATALSDHAGTALGRCVADALGKATLPRFSKPQAGVVYSVTL